MSKVFAGVAAGPAAQEAGAVIDPARSTSFKPSFKPWQAPQVITGTMDQAEFNVGPADDDDGGATPDNS